MGFRPGAGRVLLWSRLSREATLITPFTHFSFTKKKKKNSLSHKRTPCLICCTHNSLSLSAISSIVAFKYQKWNLFFFFLDHAIKLNSVKPNDLTEFYTIYVTWLSLLLRRLDLFFGTKVYYLRIWICSSESGFTI